MALPATSFTSHSSATKRLMATFRKTQSLESAGKLSIWSSNQWNFQMFFLGHFKVLSTLGRQGRNFQAKNGMIFWQMFDEVFDRWRYDLPNRPNRMSSFENRCGENDLNPHPKSMSPKSFSFPHNKSSCSSFSQWTIMEGRVATENRSFNRLDQGLKLEKLFLDKAKSPKVSRRQTRCICCMQQELGGGWFPSFSAAVAGSHLPRQAASLTVIRPFPCFPSFCHGFFGGKKKKQKKKKTPSAKPPTLGAPKIGFPEPKWRRTCHLFFHPPLFFQGFLDASSSPFKGLRNQPSSPSTIPLQEGFPGDGD